MSSSSLKLIGYLDGSHQHRQKWSLTRTPFQQYIRLSFLENASILPGYPSPHLGSWSLVRSLDCGALEPISKTNLRICALYDDGYIKSLGAGLLHFRTLLTPFSKIAQFTPQKKQNEDRCCVEFRCFFSLRFASGGECGSCRRASQTSARRCRLPM